MKILIADDHAIVRSGVKMLLTQVCPFAEITDVADSVELVRMLALSKWDIIISDISMPPGDSGLETIKKMKEYAPGTPVLILSMHPPREYAVRAIKAGASGYLLKNADTAEFIKAVNTVLSGKKYLNAEVAEIMADTFVKGTNDRSIDKLSDREFEVFKLMSSGKSVSQIARQIMLSSSTISTFRAKIFSKMGFQSTTEMMKYAVDNKLA